MKEFLLRLSEGKSLSEVQMKDAVGMMLNDEAEESEIAAFLMGLKIKGETPDEIAGMAKAMRENAVGFGKTQGAIDNCGTGGDGASTFNVSSTSAFVLASAGIKVAKHGNRSVSSKTGSADVLEYLGINLALSPSESQSLLEEIGITFLFAPQVHPKLKRIMKVRKQLKIPTAFNLIGPLANPVDLDYQLVGVYKPEFVPLFANTLAVLGRKRAVVINGAGSLDEASLAGENTLAIVEGGQVNYTTITPDNVGLPYYANTSIKGGEASQNGEILKGVLKGEKGAYRDTVLLNAGIGLYTAEAASSIPEGVKLAVEMIDSGAAYKKLEDLREYSNKFRKEAI
ncbi:anthranilate phosphoribosyltransferase [Bacillus sp. FJAT-27225]|uniref:anthranilate phosphoribosyltransferase n=1 Tax=Bacillus sp. FJAT-27225 TaxID=1743144 RepID=UPI00080C3220|nr:anthranilate phosphoribosyltransferase [Bacillus sp. FJAT-27225]OCA91527.1 anthranilate phosphoribosyltransferase [Bacillus sp. FJAT-27225]